MAELLATEPDCPNCGTRCTPGLGGIPYCRTCKVAVLPSIDLA